MAWARIYSRAQLGISAPPVVVEVHISNGLPALTMVGLPEAAVRESRDRVRSALINSGFEFPARRITINLAPADLPKEGGRFDLAIALGLLVASGQLATDNTEQLECLGELALSGELRPVQGVLPAALACHKAERHLWVAAENAEEAALVDGLKVFPASHLQQLIQHFSGQQKQALQPNSAKESLSPSNYPCLSDVKGQTAIKRALEIAAAGGHNMLMVGPPGSGKSMLANRLPGLLPTMSQQEMLDIAAVQSVSQAGGYRQICWQRPFRAPHHTSSAVALVGGGSKPKPGEISLAHNGVLFLDELPEFPRKVLEVLREPLESGEIHISRAQQQLTFPASFQLITAMNPCPCGFHNDGSDRCHCTPDQIRRYQEKISGPLLDRIDLQLWVSAIPAKQLLGSERDTQAETSDQVRVRVEQARQRQLARQGCSNQQLQGRQLEQHCAIAEADTSLLLSALERFRLSARSYHRILRVARTLADLEGRSLIERNHLMEALSYRTGLQL